MMAFKSALFGLVAVMMAYLVVPDSGSVNFAADDSVVSISLDFGVSEAEACVFRTNCRQPTPVGKGQPVPVWHVVRCVSQTGQTVDCRSAAAVNKIVRGRKVVCFIGSDGKTHFDLQSVVYVGRKFINRRIGGSWQPDWQS